MGFSFKKINKEKKQAYLILFAIALLNLFSYQNFETSTGKSKSDTDLSALLRSSESEIQKTRIDLNQGLQDEVRFDTESAKRLTPIAKIVEINGPLKIKLKRAPAKTGAKKKKKKKKTKKNKIQ